LRGEQSGSTSDRSARLSEIRVLFSEATATAIPLDGPRHPLRPLSRHRPFPITSRVSRARLTQILNLTCLAADLQEKLLFLRPYTDGRALLRKRQIRPIAAEPNWEEQRRLFISD